MISLSESDAMNGFELQLARAMNEVVLLELGGQWRDTLNLEHGGRNYVTDMEPDGVLRQQMLEVLTRSRQAFNGLGLRTFLAASDEEARGARAGFTAQLGELSEHIAASIANNAIGADVVGISVQTFIRMKVTLAFLMHLHMTRVNDHLLGLYLPTVGSFLTAGEAYENAQSSLRVLLVVCAGYESGMMNELAQSPQGVQTWGERFGLSGVGAAAAAPAVAAPAVGVALSATVVALILGVLIVVAVAIIYDRSDARNQKKIAERCDDAIRQRLPGYEVCLQGSAPASSADSILGRGIGDPINGLGAGLGKAGEWIGLAISAVLIAAFAVPMVARSMSDTGKAKRRVPARRSSTLKMRPRAPAPLQRRKPKYDDDDDDEWDGEFS